MSDIAIKVENLSKRYRIGLKEELPDTFMAAMKGWITSPFNNLQRLRKLTQFDDAPDKLGRTTDKKELITNNRSSDNFSPNDDIIWALKDVSFEVKRGEVLGIIGRNGAGKSTLLKILSRITEPTSGRAIINGRVSSLLEVGTGFHPELTGRENIYLNGTILGMSKAEVDRKFDQIVDFAEVEKFIDTPVKRYSSGMKVRLAFAVAAHLEPEILLIDEVLAVGDIAFQKKCVDKMGDVTRQGRTILFVSHNTASIQSLCPKALLLEKGRIKSMGNTQKVIDTYINTSKEIQAVNLAERTDRRGNGAVKITNVELWDENNDAVIAARTGQHVRIALRYECKREKIENVKISIVFTTKLGQHLFVCNNEITNNIFPSLEDEGYFVCTVPNFPLLPGLYSLNVYCTANGIVVDHVREASEISVEVGDFFGTGRLPPNTRGNIVVSHSWRLASSSKLFAITL